MQELAAVVLAAGSGTRLRPLTDILPKALCPVNNRPLVDYAIDNAHRLTNDVTVNAWHHSEKVVSHLEGRVRLSVESPHALGTAGALGNLRGWIDGRGVLVHNADAWHQFDLTGFAEDWDGSQPRLLVSEDQQRGDFGNLRFLGVSLLPWCDVKELAAVSSGLWESSWAEAFQEDRIEFVVHGGTYFDCGTPPDYLEANLAASGGVNVVGENAEVLGRLERCVVWPGSRVGADEHLVEMIRAPGDVTVDARKVNGTWL